VSCRGILACDDCPEPRLTLRWLHRQKYSTDAAVALAYVKVVWAPVDGASFRLRYRIGKERFSKTFHGTRVGAQKELRALLRAVTLTSM
jgi:hypothetical protein